MRPITTLSFPNRSNRTQFVCTIFQQDGSLLASLLYTSHSEAGVRIQLEEWLDAHPNAKYDLETIRIAPAKKGKRTKNQPVIR